jgi:hypothetical protein
LFTSDISNKKYVTQFKGLGSFGTSELGNQTNSYHILRYGNKRACNFLKITSERLHNRIGENYLELHFRICTIFFLVDLVNVSKSRSIRCQTGEMWKMHTEFWFRHLSGNYEDLGIGGRLVLNWMSDGRL